MGSIAHQCTVAVNPGHSFSESAPCLLCICLRTCGLAGPCRRLAAMLEWLPVARV